MREHHLQTPLKELGNRRSKSISDQIKKPLKTTTRKNLNSVFESQGASIAESSPKESIDSSLISDDHNLLTESSGFVNSSVNVLLTEVVIVNSN
ncbi:hypothetical protein RND71_031910 [Anisodus tanguticus]|uniref:Uncharacterized protein n=1 Tax=Anisodus tanguticus TaxID=243964 RepID=A0AAE1RCL1_9SOLA|nr:hypothetical protein RND71_031910 [Anisodus tanguticus]